MIPTISNELGVFDYETSKYHKEFDNLTDYSKTLQDNFFLKVFKEGVNLEVSLMNNKNVKDTNSYLHDYYLYIGKNIGINRQNSDDKRYIELEKLGQRLPESYMKDINGMSGYNKLDSLMSLFSYMKKDNIRAFPYINQDGKHYIVDISKGIDTGEYMTNEIFNILSEEQ